MNEIRKRTVMPKIRNEKNKRRCQEMLNFARKYYLKLGIGEGVEKREPSYTVGGNAN